MIFTCEKCLKIFLHKGDFEKHQNMKKDCSILINEKKYECEFCNKKFTNINNLKHHQKTNCIHLKKINELKEHKKKILEIEKNLKINSSKEIKTEEKKVSIKSNENINENINEENNLNNSSNIILEPIYKNNNKSNKSDELKEIKKLDGYIYILQEREFIKTSENIYKIGKTSKKYVIDRFKQYPNNSKLFGAWKVDNIDEFEKLIKASFTLKYNKRTDIGIEYFEGDINNMILNIENLFKSH
jgi:hypothetical protein